MTNHINNRVVRYMLASQKGVAVFQSLVLVASLLGGAIVPLSASAHGVGPTLNFAATPLSPTSLKLSWTSTSATSSPSVDQHNLKIWSCVGAGCSPTSTTPIYSYTGNNFTTDTTGLSSGTIYSGTLNRTGLTTGGTYSFAIQEKHGGFVIEQLVANIVVPPATLNVIKHVVGGGPKTAADFTLSVAGTSVSPSSFPGSETGTIVSLNAGSYNVSESSVASYVASYGSDCLSGTIASGQSKTCTVTNTYNPNTATLTLVKNVVNNNGGTAVANNFQAKIDGSNVPWGVAQVVSSTSHTASETTLLGYTASVWGTDCAANGSITLVAGDHKTCSITNDDQPAEIHGMKFEDLNGNSTKDNGEPGLSGWTINISGPTPGSAVTNGSGTYAFAGLSAGSYTVTETSQSGWTQTTANPAPVVLANGQVVNDVNFGNFKLATIKVHKNVLAPDGQTDISDSHSFTVKLNGGSPSAIDEGLEALYGGLAPGAYSVTENPDPNYDLVSITPSQVNPTSGSTTDVYIVNKQKYSHLIVIKHVVNDNGGGAVAGNSTMNVSGVNPSQTSFAGLESPGVNVTLWSGPYNADESAFTGYTKNLSADCSGTIGVGQTKTCTITNDDIAPSLTLVKYVSGGSATTEQWTLTATGTTPIFGAGGAASGPTFKAGSYDLSESAGPVNYTAGPWVCAGGTQDGAKITLALGESATCSITNTFTPPIPGSIVIVKNTVGGDGTFSFTGDLGGFDLATIGGTISKTFDELIAGTYGISESTSTGWVLTSASCDNPVNLGEDQTVTCTFVNTKDGKIIVKKVTDPSGDEQSFEFTTNYGEENFSLSGGGQNDSGFLHPGTYSVSEALPSGWNQTNATCDNGDNPSEVHLTAGETVICTFTNTKPPTLKIIKNTVGGDGTFGFNVTSTDEFSLATSTGTAEGNGSIGPITLAAGTYAVTENVPDGWVLTSVSCVYNNQSVGNSVTNGEQISLDNGDSVTCTFTDKKDVTPPVSLFTDSLDHKIIDTELLALTLTGTSTDDLSGVHTASSSIFKIGDEQLVRSPGFPETFSGLNCSNASGTIPIEIVALNLVSVNPITVSWQRDWNIPGPGVYCVDVSATDNAGNAEHTATAGPLAYVPPVPPPPPPSPTPTPPPSGGGGGGGGNGGGGGTGYYLPPIGVGGGGNPPPPSPAPAPTSGGGGTGSGGGTNPTPPPTPPTPPPTPEVLGASTSNDGGGGIGSGGDELGGIAGAGGGGAAPEPSPEFAGATSDNNPEAGPETEVPPQPSVLLASIGNIITIGTGSNIIGYGFLFLLLLLIAYALERRIRGDSAGNPARNRNR